MRRSGTGARRRTAKDDAKDAGRAQKRVEAYKLRVDGLTFNQIGERIGCSSPTALRWFTEAVEDIPATDREHTRHVENARLDGDHETAGRMLRRFVKHVESLDRIEDPAVRALAMEGIADSARVIATLIEKRTAISARRAKINGLDIDRVEHSGKDGGPIRTEVTPTAARKVIADLFGEHVVAPPTTDSEPAAAPDVDSAQGGSAG